MKNRSKVGTLVPNVTVKQLPDDVVVLDRMDVPKVFARASRRLDPEQVHEVCSMARRSIRWTSRRGDGSTA